MKINLPEGYEIDKEKSTFENIVFKKKNPAPGRSIYSLLDMINKPEQKYKPICGTNRKFTVKDVSQLTGKTARTIQRYCDLHDIPKTNIGYLLSEEEVVMLQSKLEGRLTYIIKDYSTGLYKIGKSNNPQQRERTLQSEKPTIKTVKVFKSDIESLLHKEFADVRVRGEWFKLNKVQLTRICTQYD